jgi:hypothetical protein
LPGVRIHPLEADPIEVEDCFCLVKYRDSDGETSWAYRTSRPPNREELLGALMIQVEILRKELLDEWTSE